MKNLRLFFFAVFLWVFIPVSSYAQPKTVTSSVAFQDPQGNVAANGILSLQLSVPAEISGGGQLAPSRVKITLDGTGKIPGGTTLWASDQLIPAGDTYYAQLQDSSGRYIAQFGNWLISGASPIDLSQQTPVVVGLSYPNPVILNPSGAQTGNINLAGTATITGALTVPQIDKTIWVDGVKYPNTSVGINQAITDAIALGTGAVVDARGVPSVNLTAEIDVGDTTGLHSVTLLLPPSSAWTWNMTDGTSCGIKIFSKSAIIGQDSINTVATLGMTAGANMRAVVCTDTTGTFNYSRAEGFNISVPSGATIVKGALDIEVQADGSLFRSIKVFMSGQTGIFMRDVCCGAEFSNIVVDGQSAAGSTPLVIGAASGGFINGGVQAVTCTNCSIDHPGSGKNNVSFAANSSTNNVSFNTLYMEPNATDTTTALFQIPANVYGIHILNGMASNFAGGSTAYMIDIASWAGPSGSVFEGLKSQKLNLVNDHINNVTVVGAANGQAAGYTSGPLAASALDLPEIVTAPTGVAGHELLSGDPVDHMIHQNLNNGGNQHLPYTIVMTAQYTNATTGFTTITDGTRNMSFPVNASQSYTLNCTFAVQGSVGTAGPKFQATGPSAPTSVRLFVDGGTNATAYADAVVSPFSAANTALGSLGATATDFVAHVHLSLANGVNAGTVALQAAANGSGTLTIDTGDCVWQ